MRVNPLHNWKIYISPTVDTSAYPIHYKKAFAFCLILLLTQHNGWWPTFRVLKLLQLLITGSFQIPVRFTLRFFRCLLMYLILSVWNYAEDCSCLKCCSRHLSTPTLESLKVGFLSYCIFACWVSSKNRRHQYIIPNLFSWRRFYSVLVHTHRSTPRILEK